MAEVREAMDIGSCRLERGDVIKIVDNRVGVVDGALLHEYICWQYITILWEYTMRYGILWCGKLKIVFNTIDIIMRFYDQLVNCLMRFSSEFFIANGSIFSNCKRRNMR